ncbi:MAG: selenocysteine-specific translation elongation factor [Nitrospinota bacterium]|nr:selenocysteine-specific translation elongation factor [Nitrospinota bacterium]
MENQVIIGTAGHIDHGKTSLVRSLTGTETDRLKEEKERGITIDLGFAKLNSGETNAGIVDVPGHERFVKNMLAGVGGIDIVMLVIAADEGVMPQTREHLSICELLGVKNGLIVITKSDLVEPEWISLVKDDLKEFVKETFLHKKPILQVSSETGEGIDDLKKILNKLILDVNPKDENGVFRIPIDRVFTMHGFGVVVTGTLFSGKVKTGQTIEIYPTETQAKIRGIQVHSESVEESAAGFRTAINLQGIEKTKIERGYVLGFPKEMRNTYMLDVFLELLESASNPLKNRSRVRFHSGTVEVMARVILLEKNSINPGDKIFAQIRLEKPITALPRDRFVIRSYSPMTTIGGGEILDVDPPKLKRMKKNSASRFEFLKKGSDRERLKKFIEENGISGTNFSELSGRVPQTIKKIRSEILELQNQQEILIADLDSGLSVEMDQFEKFKKNLENEIKNYHEKNPLKSSAPKEEIRSRLGKINEKIFSMGLDTLKKEGITNEDQTTVKISSHTIVLDNEQELMCKRIENIFLNAKFKPPSLKKLISEEKLTDQKLTEVIQILVGEKKLILLKGELIFHSKSLDDARSELESFILKNKEITASEFRDLLGISRKFAIPILEHFDIMKITVRVGDKRIIKK